MKKRIVFSFLYIIATILFAVVFVEGAVRLFKLAPPLPDTYITYDTDKYLPWRGRPNDVRKGRSKSGEFEYEYKYNSLGFRDAEHSQEKPKGTFRVLALGDSFTMGAGAEFHETFTSVLQTELNHNKSLKFENYELINFGVARYWQEPERVSLQYYGYKFKPDLVVVTFITNDLWDTKRRSRLKVSDGYLVTQRSDSATTSEKWLFKNFQASRIVLAKIWEKRVKTRLDPEVRLGMDQVWDNVDLEYGRIAKLTEKMKVPFVLMYIPKKPPWKEYEEQEVPQKLSKICKKVGCHFFNTLPSLKESPNREKLYWPIDGHCQPEGYKVVGQSLYNFLLKENLVK